MDSESACTRTDIYFIDTLAITRAVALTKKRILLKTTMTTCEEAEVGQNMLLLLLFSKSTKFAIIPASSDQLPLPQQRHESLRPQGLGGGLQPLQLLFAIHLSDLLCVLRPLTAEPAKKVPQLQVLRAACSRGHKQWHGLSSKTPSSPPPPPPSPGPRNLTPHTLCHV